VGDTLPTRPRAKQVEGFSVQVGAVLSQQRADETASEVRQRGLTVRVVTSTTDGTRVYRVILGPYSTRAEADRAGRLSGRSYWIFEGVP
jgi:rare lipoprotein A